MSGSSIDLAALDCQIFDGLVASMAPLIAAQLRKRITMSDEYDGYEYGYDSGHEAGYETGREIMADDVRGWAVTHLSRLSPDMRASLELIIGMSITRGASP